ncbi:hypothetical protein B0T11DRAFT_298856 [Plectosphaerella cucumerina]|uniref:Uncharacterized protein n=1 Tax=Plectosphaerella cucumerina TaxID=40658 RepID=A0A8K0TFL4_9PEZI|nr:hypothetical protein B0T11DRAFT_298856 [Plectosphaerella cucumerina]
MDANERSSLLPVHTAQPSKEPGGDTTEHKSISRAAETLSVLSIILFYLFTVISSSGCVIYSKVNKLHGTDSVLLVVITPKVIDQIWLMFGANILELSFGVAAATGKDEDERKVGRKANIIGKHFSTLSKAINIDIHLSLLAADRAMLAMFCCWTSLVGINGLVEEFKGKVNDESLGGWSEMRNLSMV